MAVKKKPSRKPRQSPRRRQLDPNIWLERAQAMQVYSNALKEADERAYQFYGTANDQIKRHFDINHRLYSVSLGIIIFLLVTSVGLAVYSRGQVQFLQNLSIAGGILAVVLLVVLLIRNPLQQAHLLLEKNLRVNVAFLGFVRRLQQSDLALRFVFMQTPSQDFTKVLMQIQDFQTILDQFSEDINQSMQD